MPTPRNSSEILRRLKRDGRVEISVKGSHHKLKHEATGRTIIVPHPKKDLPTGTTRAIAKQAGWIK
ncbi:MAG: type II toxin-antitoxin system HicA family toxin [Hyphomicrobium aestuarii]|nr:type II toxin-antitoxin system HicA family toxin [Hyphomicrobium aestuarii]